MAHKADEGSSLYVAKSLVCLSQLPVQMEAAALD